VTEPPAGGDTAQATAPASNDAAPQEG
jgi:hypothetical protein